MRERWALEDNSGWLQPSDAADLITRRLESGVLCTWFEGDAGRRIAFVTNGSRAMVLRLDHDAGDPGEHAIDPGATGVSGGFMLENGQVDEYADTDTVALHEGLRILRHLVAEGEPPSDANWQIDR